ncbi:MAG: valine dehydrogenase [Chloroflexi bacterium]|nr:valine dehydrogenase [Chloroflexota bacterium]
MGLFAAMESLDHEEVILHRDAAAGLSVIVAIHSSVRGPALGGTRWHPYASEEEALEDVLRLSSAMTYKSAAANLPFGGGKAAVIGDPAGKTPAQLRAYGRFIDSLNGRYITTTDVGTTTAEIDIVAGETRFVVGTSPERGGSGDTSVLTAATVVQGMRAALRVAFDDESFAGRRVVVVGVGKVGGRVARHLAEQGADLVLSDIRTEAAERLAVEIGAATVGLDHAYTTECDILSPNALGRVLTPASIPALRCRVVCGGANNQLANDPADAALLKERGILYAPDYVINSGGVINVAMEIEGYDTARARQLAEGVYETTLRILRAAEREGISTAEAAARLVRERLAGVGTERAS